MGLNTDNCMVKLFKFIFFMHLVIFSVIANAQTLVGRVIDSETSDPIISANIYFQGTFSGTASDLEGYFSLDISKFKNIPIIISSIGYYSRTIENKDSPDTLVISLNPKTVELSQVEIKAGSLERERKRYLRKFEDYFIGNTSNARNCTILNIEDIQFIEVNDTLRAFSDKPLIINNTSLGYSFEYYLDVFELNLRTKEMFYTGNVIFKEDHITSTDNIKAMRKRRLRTYYGSRMHFFRDLWANASYSKFLLQDFFGKSYSFSDIVELMDGKKYLKIDRTIFVSYKGRITSLIPLKKRVFFSKSGYFDPGGIRWRGDMANERIADLLPYEFSEKYIRSLSK